MQSTGPLVLVEQRPVTGRMVAVRDGATLGRSDCDVLLIDPHASRFHAVLHETPGGPPTIEDVGSTNGTWVNGRRIKTAFDLMAGDVLRLGRTVWRVEPRQAGRP